MGEYVAAFLGEPRPEKVGVLFLSVRRNRLSARVAAFLSENPANRLGFLFSSGAARFGLLASGRRLL